MAKRNSNLHFLNANLKIRLFTIMKTILKVLLVIISMNAFGQTNKTSQTVIYLVRHAEQDASIKENPPLSEKGIARANLLTDILSETPISAE